MGEKKQNPRGVTIRNHKNSDTINITFTYKGVRCREKLNIPVTQANINYAGRLLGEIQNREGYIQLCRLFPNVTKAKDLWKNY